MTPARCPSCRSYLVAHGQLTDVRFGVHFWKWVPVRAGVCLDCGLLTPYLDDAALDKVRRPNGYSGNAKAEFEEL